jgi:hypothetical protein
MASVAGCGAAAARTTSSLLLLITIVSINGSCSLLVEPDRQQCAIDDDCKLLGGDLSDAVCIESVCQANPTWSCLGTGSWPTPEQRKMSVIFRIGDLVTEQPAPGVSARLCHKLDFGCSQPIAGGMISDAGGNLPIQVDPGFDGYVELTPPGHMKAIYFFNPPVAGDREIALPVVRAEDLGLFAGLAGHPPIPGRGHVMLGAYDCRGDAAEGITLSSVDADDRTSSFYLIKKVPSITASATDSSGRGGIINLRAGSISVSGVLSDGRPIGTVGLFVRPDQITYTTLLPAPN